jgi:hypothetical protein
MSSPPRRSFRLSPLLVLSLSLSISLLSNPAAAAAAYATSATAAAAAGAARGWRIQLDQPPFGLVVGAGLRVNVSGRIIPPSPPPTSSSSVASREHGVGSLGGGGPSLLPTSAYPPSPPSPPSPLPSSMHTPMHLCVRVDPSHHSGGTHFCTEHSGMLAATGGGGSGGQGDGHGGNAGHEEGYGGRAGDFEFALRDVPPGTHELRVELR